MRKVDIEQQGYAAGLDYGRSIEIRTKLWTISIPIASDVNWLYLNKSRPTLISNCSMQKRIVLPKERSSGVVKLS